MDDELAMLQTYLEGDAGPIAAEIIGRARVLMAKLVAACEMALPYLEGDEVPLQDYMALHDAIHSAKKLALWVKK